MSFVCDFINEFGTGIRSLDSILYFIHQDKERKLLIKNMVSVFFALIDLYNCCLSIKNLYTCFNSHTDLLNGYAWMHYLYHVRVKITSVMSIDINH